MGPGHPECPERLVAIEKALKTQALWPRLNHQQAKPVDRSLLRLTHTEDLLHRLESPVSDGAYAFIDPDTCMNTQTYEAILLASGAVLQAIDAVMAGDSRHAFCAVRPPGHHAERESAMGFCFVNHIALGALYARQKHGVERVAVIDFDVHHGNGTEDILANEKGVLMVSSFQQGIYPGSGTRPRGQNMVNVPLQAGAGSQAIRLMLKNHWLPRAARVSASTPTYFGGVRCSPRGPLGWPCLDRRRLCPYYRRAGWACRYLLPQSNRKQPRGGVLP